MKIFGVGRFFLNRNGSDNTKLYKICITRAGHVNKLVNYKTKRVIQYSTINFLPKCTHVIQQKRANKSKVTHTNGPFYIFKRFFATNFTYRTLHLEHLQYTRIEAPLGAP